MTKILVVKPSSLGDVIHAFPVVSALGRGLPGCRIDWVVRPEYAELVKAHPAVRKVWIFDRTAWGDPLRVGRTIPEIFYLFRAVRRQRYDTVLDLQGLFRSALVAWLSGAGRRVGFSNARELAPLFYTRKVRVQDPAIHAVDRYLLFLEEMGVHDPGVRFGLTIPERARRDIRALLRQEGVGADRPTILLNPHARWPTKKWSAERWAALADRLVRERGAAVVVIGGPSEAAEGRRLEQTAGQMLHDFTGRTTLLQCAALMEEADLVVTCDSGPMHLAAAVGTPVLALFGPTDPARTGPYGPGHRVIRAGVECAPCLRRRCPREERICMTALSVDRVFEAASEMLDQDVPAQPGGRRS